LKISKEAKIGIVAIAGIALLYLGVNYLKGIYVLLNQTVLYGVYDKINGLEAANPITLNGFKVGQIKNVELMNNGKGSLLVTMVIYEDLKIPKDSKARIMSSDLLGSMKVNLELGKANLFLESKDTILSSIDSDLKEAINAQLSPLKNKAETLIGSIDSILFSFNAILNKDAQKDLASSFSSFSNSLKNLENTSANLDGLLVNEKAKISKIFSNVESISTNLVANNQKISEILFNFSAITDSLAKYNFKMTLDNANKSIADVSEILKKINEGKGSLGLLVNNDSLYNNLNNASEELDLLMEDLRLHPKRYVHFSLFGKKEKDNELTDAELQQIEDQIKDKK
jgi:phospholipid/cholesterol/gamma-HCH transport system substrate-binding protein